MKRNIPAKLKAAWESWSRIARRIGDFQARVLLTLIYFLAVLPFGVTVRLWGDPLRIKNRPGRWIDRPTESFDMSWAQKQ